MNDYHLIMNRNDQSNILKPISVFDTNNFNKKAKEFIKKEIKSGEACIVLTHHAPLFSDKENNFFTADPIYLNGKNNEAFHNDLKDLMGNLILVWLYGHTHYVSRFVYENTLVATNQLGYLSEERDIKFNPYAFVDLDKIMLDRL